MVRKSILVVGVALAGVFGLLSWGGHAASVSAAQVVAVTVQPKGPGAGNVTSPAAGLYCSGVTFGNMCLNTEGNGHALMTPIAINCPGTCASQGLAGKSVTFTAAASPGSVFAGWGGACAAAGTKPVCTVKLPTTGGSVNVVTTFNKGR